jgi:hypothetical protein
MSGCAAALPLAPATLGRNVAGIVVLGIAAITARQVGWQGPAAITAVVVFTLGPGGPHRRGADGPQAGRAPRGQP